MTVLQERQENKTNMRCLPLLPCVLFPASLQIEAKTGDPEAGRAVYEKSCKACHGATG